MKQRFRPRGWQRIQIITSLRIMSLALIGLTAGGARATLIHSAVVFPTADSLRVVMALESDKACPGVDIHAEIRLHARGPILWAGVLERVDLKAGEILRLEHTIADLKPQLWSPGSPSLYDLAIIAEAGGKSVDSVKLRTGFRSVESRDGQILLNGQPIFLCGLAINPPGRGVPDDTAYTRKFAYDYVKFMRSRNFNCLRMNVEFAADPRAQVWFDACDELGMLVYQGCYGSPPSGVNGDHAGKNDPPEDVTASVAAYQKVFETYARHPAIVIYILSNELPYAGKRGQAWHAFLTAACERLKAWDSTRLYIGNAGYGEGKEGDINDVHRYWGWYYNSFLTYYNLRTAHDLFGARGAVQPFTFSECVGSFTSTLGEFNLTFRKQLGAQLNWTGHSPDQAGDALAYQAFMANRACESFRTLREVNPRLAGLMPFTILFYNWNGIRSFDQMRPKPVVDAMATAYQPVLLAWELWTPQAYAGKTLHPFAHVVNDAENFAALTNSTLTWQLTDASGRSITSGEKQLPPVPYFGHQKEQLALAIPDRAATGDYMLTGQIQVAGRIISRNQVPVFIAGHEWASPAVAESLESNILLYDPAGRTASALAALGINAKSVADLERIPADARLIIGEEADSERDLGGFVRNGGRVLILRPGPNFKTAWFPVRMEMLTGSPNDVTYLNRVRPTAQHLYINIERADHPVFAGLERKHWRIWNDYTGWDQCKPGFPAIYPVTRGFRLTRGADLTSVAILADYDRGLEGIALAEVFEGKGSIILTGLDLVARQSSDPVADRVLRNLVAYLGAADHPRYPLIREPIRWGKYATEHGLITGPLNGLVVNCRWVPPPTDPEAKPLPDNQGAWNTAPGEQFVAFGRRIIGPYTYNAGTATVEEDEQSPAGTGGFDASLPPGRTAMITTVENPAAQDGRIEIGVNGAKRSLNVRAGQTVTLRNELSGAPTTVHVTCRGDKHLVLVETRFE